MLQKWGLSFIGENAAELIAQDAFLTLSKERLKILLDYDELAVESEGQLFQRVRHRVALPGLPPESDCFVALAWAHSRRSWPCARSCWSGARQSSSGKTRIRRARMVRRSGAACPAYPSCCFLAHAALKDVLADLVPLIRFPCMDTGEVASLVSPRCGTVLPSIPDDQ